MRNRKFEKWFAKHIEEPLEKVERMWNGRTYEDYAYNVETAWAGWCAALGFIKE